MKRRAEIAIEFVTAVPAQLALAAMLILSAAHSANAQSPSSATASPTDRANADRIAEEAFHAFGRNEYAVAYRNAKASYTLVPNPLALYVAGTALYSCWDFEQNCTGGGPEADRKEALDDFERYLALIESDPEQRKKHADEYNMAKNHMLELREGATEPGAHSISSGSSAAKSKSAAKTSFEQPAATTNAVPAVPVESAPPKESVTPPLPSNGDESAPHRSKKQLAIGGALIGAGALMLGVGAVMVAIAYGQSDGDKTGTLQNYYDSIASLGNQRTSIGNPGIALLAVGGAAALAGVVTLVLPPKRDTRSTLWLKSTGSGLLAGGTF